MASEKQIAANRLNATKSTGPRSVRGKSRSRRNALRHGLSAATIVDVFENADEYRAFEREILRVYQPKTAVNRELVLRLASLLWRLRRAAGIERSLFNMHALGCKSSGGRGPSVTTPLVGPGTARLLLFRTEQPSDELHSFDPAEIFQRLSNLSGDTFDRLRRYEVTLWRQVAQILLLLQNSDLHPHQQVTGSPRRHRKLPLVISDPDSDSSHPSNE